MITEQTHSASSTTECVADGFDIEGWTNAPLRLQQVIQLAAPQAEIFALNLRTNYYDVKRFIP